MRDDDQGIGTIAGVGLGIPAGPPGKGEGNQRPVRRAVIAHDLVVGDGLGLPLGQRRRIPDLHRERAVVERILPRLVAQHVQPAGIDQLEGAHAHGMGAAGREFGRVGQGVAVGEGGGLALGGADQDREHEG